MHSRCVLPRFDPPDVDSTLGEWTVVDAENPPGSKSGRRASSCRGGSLDGENQEFVSSGQLMRRGTSRPSASYETGVQV